LPAVVVVVVVLVGSHTRRAGFNRAFITTPSSYVYYYTAV
jgi:hypothetical protein